MAYGADRDAAVAKVQALAQRVLAECREEERERYLETRARRASREACDAALAAVPDVAPDVYDVLAHEVARLDPAEERALAEEGLEADFRAWPEYSSGGEEQARPAEGHDVGVTDQLDCIYSMEDSSLDAALRQAQRRSVELRDELDRRLGDQNANPGVGRPWPEAKARLLDSE